MIIYENNIKNFIFECKPANQDYLIAKIKRNMRYKMGRGVAESEERSWRTTLVKASKFFEVIKNKKNQYILLEFKVPFTFKRIDVILVGSDGKKNSLLIIELKGWSESFESNIKNTLKINSSYRIVGHPNKEADQYKYLLTEQFSDINSKFDNIEAVSLLPNYKLVENDPIISSQFNEILEVISLYTKDNLDEFIKLIKELFKKGIPRKKMRFLNKLEYKPSLNFQKHLENNFKDIKLTLKQEIAYNTIISEIDAHFNNPQNRKLVTISGMPGSGKTVVAFKLLAYFYSTKKLTAKLQLPGPEFRDAVKKTHWDNDFVNMIGGAYSKGEQAVQIIDEAHKAYGQGTSKQFYSEIFENQNFVVVLIDDKQVVNKKGFLKSDVIAKARKKNFDIIELDLEEQFRNGADALYIDWLNNWIFNQKNQQEFYVNNTYDFHVLNDKKFNKKYKKMYLKNDIRMVSFWTQKWNAEFNEDFTPKKLIKVGSSRYIWNPNEYWVKSFYSNHPNSKIPSWFTKEVINKNFNKEKKGLDYIAYFNTVQGSEFEYIFVHLPKLFFLNEKNELDVDLMRLDFTDMKTQVWTKNGLPNKEKEEQNKKYIKNRLLVALTRGTKGTFVYCEDEKLQEWLSEKLIKK